MAPRVEQIGAATLYLGDCREIVPHLVEGIGTVVSDPPVELDPVHFDTACRRIEQAQVVDERRFEPVGSLFGLV